MPTSSIAIRLLGEGRWSAPAVALARGDAIPADPGRRRDAPSASWPTTNFGDALSPITGLGTAWQPSPRSFPAWRVAQDRDSHFQLVSDLARLRDAAVMECPFCGSEMEPGTIKIKTLHPVSTSLTWKPHHDRSEPQRLMKAGLFGGQGREARYCYGCDAVLLDPAPPSRR